MPDFIPWRTIDAQLRSSRTIWISVTRRDGRPHAVPVWFWWDGKSVYFCTGRSSQKAKNLAHQPWIVVHIGDGDDAIMLQGTARKVTDKEERERVNSGYIEKYVCPYSGKKATCDDQPYRVHLTQWRGYTAIPTPELIGGLKGDRSIAGER